VDKNDHLRNLLGGHSEHIGDWTPQQLADFIQSQSNDPTQMPHAFTARQVNLTEGLIVGGKPFEHAVIPRGVTMGDAKGKAVPVFPALSGSAALNQAYRDLNPAPTKNVFAESFDMRVATGASTFGAASGTARATAIYVPTKNRLSNLRVNYTTFQAGGTFTYGGYAVYGPLSYDPATGVVLITAIPQVAITETNLVTNFRATGPHFVSGGLHAMGTPWNIVVERGIYFVVMLYVMSVASATDPEWLVMNVPQPGVADQTLAVPGFLENGTRAGLTTLPASLDMTAYAYNSRRIWYDFYDDESTQI
jgi:hypothetical protein